MHILPRGLTNNDGAVIIVKVNLDNENHQRISYQTVQLRDFHSSKNTSENPNVC